jgi:hypothetical protein
MAVSKSKSRLKDASRDFRGAGKKIVSAFDATKDGLIQEGGAVATFFKSGKGKKALKQALGTLTGSFSEHRSQVLAK